MHWLKNIYLALGSSICGWFVLACLLGWRAPDLGIAGAMNASGSSSTGRSSGGFWGGGK